jgi:hypothetical protein
VLYLCSSMNPANGLPQASGGFLARQFIAGFRRAQKEMNPPSSRDDAIAPANARRASSPGVALAPVPPAEAGERSARPQRVIGTDLPLAEGARGVFWCTHVCQAAVARGAGLQLLAGSLLLVGASRSAWRT